VLKALQGLGCGKYVPGRKGHVSRFQWAASMPAIGRYASGKADAIDDSDRIASGEGQHELLDADTEPQLGSGRHIEHEFRLRPDRTIVVELPADLTSTEAERFAGFIKMLPFGG
jgi:hypothetical protein